MEKYTKEEKEKMIKTGAVSCPKCKSYVLRAEGLEPSNDGKSFYQEVICEECGERWKEEYKLSDVTRLEKE